MSVAPRYITHEFEPEIDEQVHEIVIRVTPGNIPEIDYAHDCVVLYQNVISAEIGMSH
jgi:hypothetical protein